MNKYIHVINADGTCPTEGCIHNELIELDEEP